MRIMRRIGGLAATLSIEDVALLLGFALLGVGLAAWLGLGHAMTAVGGLLIWLTCRR